MPVPLQPSLKSVHSRAVARILAWGGVLKLGARTGEARRAESGEGFSFKRFLAFYGHYMAFSDISVASGHVPVAKYF